MIIYHFCRYYVKKTSNKDGNMSATQYAIAKRIESQPNCKRVCDPKLKIKTN